MKYKFCPKCGRKLEMFNCWDEGYVPYCPKDDILYFDTPRPCIVVGVIKGDEILLLKQSYIYKNSKVLISGYVDQDECAEETVYREVLEETGIKVQNIKYLGSDFVKGKELLMITFMADYSEGEINKSDEVEGIGWVKINDALGQMKEDKIGSKVVEKIIKLRE
ncbi:NAD(+) diphosphatase [Eubacterium multiforme]|uniref:NAD(+) diphosphatase n=1 Tax=Eubacterium multiforme TaxID=83339 RepID=A0ABT9UT09_9FIRM|nr:NUDIX domain-containing protein [Eubacterium multiforme]MDQ0149483.1 NAD+ diphosphatase [Eubacterium multiforme]